MSNNMHRPAAAWSRDSLAAWQWMIDKTDPQSGIGSSPDRCHEMFLRRWAIKILSLVSDEMPYSDWYWFLNDHFHKELFRRWPGTTERLNEFRNPNTRETDPAGEMLKGEMDTRDEQSSAWVCRLTDKGREHFGL